MTSIRRPARTISPAEDNVVPAAAFVLIQLPLVVAGVRLIARTRLSARS